MTTATPLHRQEYGGFVKGGAQSDGPFLFFSFMGGRCGTVSFSSGGRLIAVWRLAFFLFFFFPFSPLRNARILLPPRGGEKQGDSSRCFFFFFFFPSKYSAGEKKKPFLLFSFSIVARLHKNVGADPAAWGGPPFSLPPPPVKQVSFLVEKA